MITKLCQFIVCASIAAGPSHCPAQIRLTAPDGRWLVDRLISVADNGALFSPATLADDLGVQFGQPEHRLIAGYVYCGDPRFDGAFSQLVYSAKAPWLRPFPELVAALRLISRNGAAPLEVKPAISYAIYQGSACDAKTPKSEIQEAHVSISSLVGITCLSHDSLARTLSSHHLSTTQVVASEGVRILAFDGLANDQFSTVLTFTFWPGQNCADSADIRQRIEGGYRYLRASQKWSHCADKVEQRFCLLHRPVTSHDDVLNEAVRMSCGRAKTAYETEALSGDAPIDEASPPVHAHPCQ